MPLQRRRDEEAVAHRVELGLQVCTSPGAQRRSTTPAREGPEHHVEPEIRGDHEQSEEQDHGPAKGGLRGRMLTLGEDSLDLLVSGQPRDEGEQ